MKRISGFLFFLLLMMSFSSSFAQTTINQSAVQTAILNGITELPSGNSPGYMVVYGENAVPLVNYAEGAGEGPALAAATWGNGRVLAMPDHQMVNMNQWGDVGTNGTFYQNGLTWLANGDANPTIISYSQDTVNWLVGKGYDATVSSSGSLATDLASADIFVGWIGSSQSDTNLDALAQFTQNGGGMFLAEYGSGYTFWWGSDVDDVRNAPANRLLRPIGIGFPKSNKSDSGQILVDKNTTHVTIDDYYNIMANQSTATDLEVGTAIQLLAGIGDTLPADSPIPAQMYAVFTSDVRATPNDPVTDATDKAKLRAEMDVLRNLPPSQISAHPTAEDVYGAIPAGAAHPQQTKLIDADVTRWHSTGAYVVPGETVQVTVPAEAVGQGYRVIVSGHEDDISPRDSWNRVPYGVQRIYPIDNTTIDIGNAFGGAIYIDVGATPPADFGIADFTVTIDNAIQAPYFILGETTDAEWNAGIKDYPAPYAELESDGVIIALPSNEIRNLTNPEELMTYWNKVVEVQDYAGSLDNLRTNPERINADVQISVGLLHAGYPIQGPNSENDGLVDWDNISVNGSWGYFHELGHEMQRRPDKNWGWQNPYTFDGDVEVTVNIFSAAALQAVTTQPSHSGWGTSFYPLDNMIKAQASVASGGTFDSKDPYPFYFQLSHYFEGFDTYRAVLETYNEDVLNGTEVSGNVNKKTAWLMRWSAEVNYDMRCYMVDQWGLQVSLTAAQTAILDGMPCWLPTWGSLADQEMDVGTTLPLDIQGNAHAVDKNVTIVSVSAQSGSITDAGNGTYNYQPVSAGDDVVTYILRSSEGNEQTFTATITAEAPAVCPNPLVVTTLDDSGNCTLRNAVSLAQDGDTITFDPAIQSGTILFESPISIGNSITIDGQGIILDGQNRTDIFDVADSQNIELVDLTITNGRSGHGSMIVRWGAVATIRQVSFIDNTTTQYAGGAIHSQSAVKIYNSTFSGNRSTNGTAAVLGLRNTGNEIYNSTFALNSSTAGSISVSDGTGLAMYNNIIADVVGCSGVAVTTSTNNFVTDNSCGATWSGDAMLGGLDANNSHPLLAGSPALDKGDSATCLATDQTGATRDAICDLGAVESVMVETGQTVNCDSEWNLIDVILIKRYNVFLISATTDCVQPSANEALYLSECDRNGDSVCGLVDAVILQQCNSFIMNDYCPAQ